jgi:LAO/AO transport system kinase
VSVSVSDAVRALADRVIARDPRAVARAISIVENELPAAADLVGRLHPHTGRAYLVGVTGPPGAGKSTLVDALIARFRATGVTVGVLAVDPTSPYTGGAILGDRVRMQAHAEDAGVFIRSMATRGHLGGLARTSTEAASLLDAAGFDIVIIETVGVGQDEVDIVRTADVSIVTLVPGAGDEVQALKAGIMEIADIFVVNKADREGADRTAASIDAMLTLDHWPAGRWRPPVLRTVATTGAGVPELVETIGRFRAESTAALGARRRSRAEWRLREILGRRFMQHVEQDVLADGEFDRLLERIASREIDPYGAADLVMEKASGVLDHVGIAVPDASRYIALLDRLFGLKTGAPEDVGPHRVRFVETGGTTLELIEPGAPDSAIAKFLEKRGAGLHHLCLLVDDLDAALAALKAKGVRLIDDVPRAGAHGSRIAFLHPRSAEGLLIELKERVR